MGKIYKLPIPPPPNNTEGECNYCHEPMVQNVGFGPNPIRVCQEHLDEWLDVDV
jgi:hypothetical protein